MFIIYYRFYYATDKRLKINDRMFTKTANVAYFAIFSKNVADVALNSAKCCGILLSDFLFRINCCFCISFRGGCVRLLIEIAAAECGNGLRL